MNSVDGLPAHPLLVHLAAVVIPAAAILAVVAVVWPRARRWMAWMPPVVALIAVIVTPLTTSAGEALRRHTPSNADLVRHAHLGGQMIYWIVPLFIAITAFVALHSPTLTSFETWLQPAVKRGVSIVFSVAIVLFAAGSMVWVYRIGDTGARSVWGH